MAQPTPTDLGRADSPLSPHVTIPERAYTTVPLTRLQVDNQPSGQDASLIEAATQTTSTAMPGVKLTSPIAPLDQMEEEKWYVLVMTTSIRQFNLETALPRGSTFQNPHMAAVLLGPVPARRVISDQGAIVKELERSDAE